MVLDPAHAPGDAHGLEAEGVGEGDLGAVAKLKDVRTGDLLTDKDISVEPPSIEFPEPVMSFAITPKAKGDEEKVATAIRRPSARSDANNPRRSVTGRASPTA